MTGFDNIMRSQQMAEQSRQYWGGLGMQARQQGMAQLQQGLQFATEQVRMGAQEQRMRAETNMRLALMEQERQENAMKLQTMAAMDQVRMSRLQTDLMQSQVDSAQFDLERKKKLTGWEEQDRTQDLARKTVDVFGMEGLLSSGVRPEIGQNGEIIDFVKDPEGAKSQLELLRTGNAEARLQEAERRRWMEFERNSRSARIQQLQKQLSDPMLFGDIGAEQRKALLDELNSLIMHQGYGAQPYAPSGAAPPATPPPPPRQNGTATPAPRQQASPPDEKMPQGWQDHLPRTESAAYRLFMADQPWFAKLDEKRQYTVSKIAAAIANDLSENNTEAAITPEGATRVLGKLFRENPLTAGIVLRAAGYSDDQIRLMFRGRGMSQSDIDMAMGRVESETQRYLNQ